MIRPQDLRPIGDLDRLVRLAAGMRGGKRLMAGGVPVLRQHHVPEASLPAG